MSVNIVRINLNTINIDKKSDKKIIEILFLYFIYLLMFIDTHY